VELKRPWPAATYLFSGTRYFRPWDAGDIFFLRACILAHRPASLVVLADFGQAAGEIQYRQFWRH